MSGRLFRIANTHLWAQAKIIPIILGLFLYLTLGLYTELRLTQLKPIPDYLLEDFRYYQRALADALDGRNPYEVRDIGPAFLYPPPALLVVELFSAISPFLLTASVYILMNIALLLLMTYGIARHYGYTLNKVWYWFPLVLGFAPFLELLHIGQINMITQFGIFLMFLGEISSPILAGSGLGLAIVTKLTPVAFLGYLAIHKRFKVIVVTMGVVLALSLLALARYGPQPFLTYPGVLQELLSEFPLGTNSQSLVAKLAVANAPEFQRFLQQLPPAWQPPLLKLASFFTVYTQAVQTGLTIYLALIVAISGLATLFLKEREPLFIVVALAMMLSPNILWYHHYVFILLPLLVWMAWSRLNARVIGWCLAGLFIIQVDRRYLTYGLLIHLFAHISLLLLLGHQIGQLYRLFKPGPALVSEAQL